MGYMKFLLFISLVTSLSFMKCTSDNFLDTMKMENIKTSTYTITEDQPERSVYYKISDSGQSNVQTRFDDGDYPNTPYPITLEIKNNIFNNDDIVADHISNLIWTKCTALENNIMDTDDQCLGGTHELYTWDEGMSLCTSLVYGGYDDWRMPTLTELFSLVNFDYTAPAIDSAVFPNTEGTPGNDGMYWGTTSYKDTTTNLKWHINFNTVDGPNYSALMFVNISNSFDRLYLRCVRGK